MTDTRRRHDKKVKPYGPCTPTCAGWKQCTEGRQWAKGPVPCETLLDDEIGVDFDPDATPSLWVIPLVVSVNVTAL